MEAELPRVVALPCPGELCRTPPTSSATGRRAVVAGRHRPPAVSARTRAHGRGRPADQPGPTDSVGASLSARSLKRMPTVRVCPSHTHQHDTECAPRCPASGDRQQYGPARVVTPSHGQVAHTCSHSQPSMHPGRGPRAAPPYVYRWGASAAPRLSEPVPSQSCHPPPTSPPRVPAPGRQHSRRRTTRGHQRGAGRGRTTPGPAAERSLIGLGALGTLGTLGAGATLGALAARGGRQRTHTYRGGSEDSGGRRDERGAARAEQGKCRPSDRGNSPRRLRLALTPWRHPRRPWPSPWRRSQFPLRRRGTRPQRDEVSEGVEPRARQADATGPI